MAKRKRKMKRAHPRHPFTIEVDYHDGNGPVKRHDMAKVVLGTQPVLMKLSTKDIEESLALDGVGDSMLCAMSQSCKRQRTRFPHPTVGPVDWLFKTVFVASKRDKDGKICECVKYEHRDEIAKLFDNTAGLKKLLRQAYDNGGYIEVQLIPARNRVGESHDGGSRPRTGERTTPLGMGKGSKRRYALAMAGHSMSKLVSNAADKARFESEAA